MKITGSRWVYLSVAMGTRPKPRENGRSGLPILSTQLCRIQWISQLKAAILRCSQLARAAQENQVHRPLGHQQKTAALLPRIKPLVAINRLISALRATHRRVHPKACSSALLPSAVLIKIFVAARVFFMDALEDWLKLITRSVCSALRAVVSRCSHAMPSTRK